jgi:hypothetical protein
MGTMKPGELLTLRHGMAAAEREIQRLTVQVNEMKGLALALVNVARSWRASLHASIGDEALAAEVRAAPVAISAEQWKAATDDSPERGGKGCVLLVEPQPDGSVLVNVGDLEDAPAVVPAGQILEG